MTAKLNHQDTVRRLTEWELEHQHGNKDALEQEVLAVLEELADLANCAAVRRGESRMDPTTVALESQRLFQAGCDRLRGLMNASDTTERLTAELHTRGAA